jgi:hypothetical protein
MLELSDVVMVLTESEQALRVLLMKKGQRRLVMKKSRLEATSWQPYISHFPTVR